MYINDGTSFTIHRTQKQAARVKSEIDGRD